MPNNLAVTDLLSSPYKVRSMQLGKQVLTRANGQFQAVVNGRCALGFSEGVVLSIEWAAIGLCDEQGIVFSVKAREGFEPQLEGATLVSADAEPLSWHEQSSSLLAVISALDWHEAVKDLLAQTYQVGADL